MLKKILINNMLDIVKQSQNVERKYFVGFMGLNIIENDACMIYVNEKDL